MGAQARCGLGRRLVSGQLSVHLRGRGGSLPTFRIALTASSTSYTLER
jgi:hypothetical protein